jgi:LPXTG-motif cell wall-anchored protein
MKEQMAMQKGISRISLIIITIVVIAGGSVLGNLAGVANAQLQPVKYDWKVTKLTVFSSNKTADGVTHTLFAATYNWTGHVEGTLDVTHTRDSNLQTGIGKGTFLGTANVKILGKGPDKITIAADVTYTGLKDGIIQLEGLWWCFNGQGALKGVEGQGTLKGVSIPGKSAGTGEGQVRFGPEVAETTSPISYAILGMGIVLIAGSAVLFTRKKKV